MENAKTAMITARNARMFRDLLEQQNDHESYELRLKLDEYVEWVIDELFTRGNLEFEDLEIVKEFINHDTIEEAAEAHGCTPVWYYRLLKAIYELIDESMHRLSV